MKDYFLLDFGGGEDDVTSAAVGLVLDSLDDIHCLLEAKHQVKDGMNSPQKDGKLKKSFLL